MAHQNLVAFVDPDFFSRRQQSKSTNMVRQLSLFIVLKSNILQLKYMYGKVLLRHATIPSLARILLPTQPSIDNFFFSMCSYF